MFRFLSSLVAGPPPISFAEVSQLHPAVIEALLERCWNRRAAVAGLEPGHPDFRSSLQGRPDALINPALSAPVQSLQPGGPIVNVPALDAAISTFAGGIYWNHLMYAYMIENTRVVEIFRRVLDNFLHGERLSFLRPESQRWLWTTEELFFRDPPPFSTATLTSAVRPSMAATRANAYQRMFGITLNVAADANRPAFAVAEHGNNDFISVLDSLLAEIWQGHTNFANIAGARPTDDSKIVELTKRLADMLLARRGQGTLSREEFMAVSAMAWFHATLDGDTPIVRDLSATAPSVEERLFKIAQRVGYPAHGLSKSYFAVAEPLSRILVSVEQGSFNSTATVPLLYTTTAPPSPSADTETIMTHWSIIRGRDVKARKVVAVA